MIFISAHEMLIIYSNLINSRAVFTLVVKKNNNKNGINHEGNVLDFKLYLEKKRTTTPHEECYLFTVWSVLRSPHYGQV